MKNVDIMIVGQLSLDINTDLGGREKRVAGGSRRERSRVEKIFGVAAHMVLCE